MAIEHIFDSASSVMTVISFTTFLGILLWTFLLKGGKDFETQAALPFADEWADQGAGNAGAPSAQRAAATARGESGHG